MAVLSRIVYFWRCAACSAVMREQVNVGEVVRGEQESLVDVNGDEPPGWKMYRVRPPGIVWLCDQCLQTPDESRALVALKLGLRFMSR